MRYVIVSNEAYVALKQKTKVATVNRIILLFLWLPDKKGTKMARKLNSVLFVLIGILYPFVNGKESNNTFKFDNSCANFTNIDTRLFPIIPEDMEIGTYMVMMDVLDCNLTYEKTEETFLDSNNSTLDYFQSSIQHLSSNKRANCTYIMEVKKAMDFLDRAETQANVWFQQITFSYQNNTATIKLQLLLTLQITNVNNKVPTFNKTSYEITIPETLPTYLDIVMLYYKSGIEVHDEDYPGDDDSRLTFTVFEGSKESETFSVSANSSKKSNDFRRYNIQLILKKSLDYSITQKYTLTLKANDGKNIGYTTVIIHLISTVLPHPQFERPKYELKILKDSQLKKDEIITFDQPIKAFAKRGTDYKVNYKINYVASDDDAKFFSIVENPSNEMISGLKVIETPQPDEIANFIFVNLQACLQVDGKQCNQTFLKIIIEVEPTTTKSTATTTASMPTKPSTTTPTAAAPTTTEPTDQTTLSMSSTSTTTATTSEEEKIQFSFPIYNVTVGNVTDGTLICTVSAGPYAKYKLKTDNSPFKINETRGDIIFVGKSLPHLSRRILDVEAYSITKPAETIPEAEAKVNIAVNYGMVNGVSFKRQYFNFSVEENFSGAIKNSKEQLFVESDSNLYYKICNLDLPSKFTLNSMTAILSTKELDYETNPRYVLIVEISENKNEVNCDENKDNKAMVTIDVLDVNEPPVFAKENGNYPYLGIMPSETEGTLITTFQATDPDIEDEITFELKEKSDSFELQPNGNLYFIGKKGENIQLIIPTAKDNEGEKDELNIKMFYLNTEDIFILTKPTKSSRSKTTRSLPQQRSKRAVVSNIESIYKFLHWISEDTGLTIGLIPQKLQILSNRIILYLFTTNKDSVLPFRQVSEKLESLNEDIEPLETETTVKTTTSVLSTSAITPSAVAAQPTRDNNLTIIIVLAVILCGLLIILIGIFIYKWWRRRVSRDPLLDETESKEFSSEHSKEFEYQSNHQNNPIYDDTNDLTFIKVSEESKLHFKQEPEHIDQTVFENNKTIEIKNELNNDHERISDLENQRKAHPRKISSFSPVYAKLTDQEVIFEEIESLPDQELEVPLQDSECNDNKKPFTTENQTEIVDTSLKEKEILTSNDDMQADNEFITEQETNLNGLHLPQNKNDFDVVDSGDSIFDDCDVKNEEVDINKINIAEESADESEPKTYKKRKRLKSVVTFNEVPEVITLPSEEISKL